MVRPGQVVRLYSTIAGKPKFHLCISLSHGFVFLNSPKAKSYPGDLEVPCSDIPCLPPTAEGKSIISLSLVVQITEGELRRRKAEILGIVDKAVLLKIVSAAEDSEVLSDEDRERILDGLDGWV